MRIMILEDDPWIADLLKQIALSIRPGISVDVINTVGGALNSLQHTNYVAVLADWNLPDATGLNFLDSLRAHDQETPVLIVTSRSDRESVLSAKHLGISAFITKPFDISRVIEVLEPLLPTEKAQDYIHPPADDFSSYLAQLTASELGLPMQKSIRDRLQSSREGQYQDLKILIQEWQNVPAVYAHLIAAANGNTYMPGAEKPCLCLKEAIARLGLMTSLNLIFGLVLRAPDSHPLGLFVDVFFVEQLKASERLGNRAAELARQCSLDPSPFQTAAMLHRLGELSVIYAAQCWESRGEALSEEQLSKAINEYAQPFALMIKAHLGIPRHLQELIGAVYALPKMQVRQEQVIMRLAGAEMMNESQSVLQKLKRLAGVS